MLINPLSSNAFSLLWTYLLSRPVISSNVDMLINAPFSFPAPRKPQVFRLMTSSNLRSTPDRFCFIISSRNQLGSLVNPSFFLFAIFHASESNFRNIFQRINADITFQESFIRGRSAKVTKWFASRDLNFAFNVFITPHPFKDFYCL